LSVESCLFNLPGKCEKEKKKKQNCIINNLVACELSPYRQSSKNIDICTNLDGFFWALTGSCDGYVSYECGGPSSSSGSKK
jgi:hypothetical protein